MRAWAAAKEEPKGPGLFARIGGLFRRKPSEAAEPVAEPVLQEIAEEIAPSRPSHPASLDLVQIEALGANAVEPMVEESEMDAATGIEEPAVEPEPPVAEEAPPSVAPPQDFSFPWSRLGVQSAPPPPVDVDSPSIEEDFSASADAAQLEVPVEQEPGSSEAELDQAMSSVQEMAEDTPTAAKPGFFERLFGRRRKTDETQAVETDAPVEGTLPEEPSVEFAEEPPPEPVAEAPAAPDEVDERYEAALRGLRNSMGIVAPQAPAEPEEQAIVEEVPEAELSVTESSAEEATAQESTFDDFAQTAHEQAGEIEAPKRGLFARLFGRKKEVEAEVAEPVASEEAPEAEAIEQEAAEPEVAEPEVVAEQVEELPFVEGTAFAEAIEETAPAEEPGAVEESAPAFDGGATQDFVETPLVAAFDPESTLDPDAAPAAFDPEATLDPNEAPAFDGEATLDPAEAAAFDPSATQPYEEPAPAEDYGETTQEVDGGSTIELEQDVNRPTVAAEVVAEQLGTTGEMPKKPGLIARLLGRSQEKTGELPPVPADDGEVSFLIAKYRAFYTEIIRAQEQKAKLTAGFSTAIMSEAQAEETSPENAAAELGWHLQQILELQTAEANWMRGEAQEKYPEAQYAMVALADELFHVVEWQGKSAWPRHGLEAKLFHSYSSHVEFFNRIDRMLRDPMPTKGAKDIARIYLMVLASGFEGMYREPGLKRPLAEYRRRLYEFIHGKFALEIYEPERKLIPQTTTNLLAGRAVGRFTQAQRWTALVIILLAAYTFVAHLAWNTMTADLKDVTARIEALTSAPGAK